MKVELLKATFYAGHPRSIGEVLEVDGATASRWQARGIAKEAEAPLIEEEETETDEAEVKPKKGK